MKQLYLYIDNFSFGDYFSTNSISSEAFLPNKKGTRTLGRNTSDFLFLTHKKIDEESRLHGITDQLTCWPVTLEFAIYNEKIDKFPVVFVERNGEESTLKCGDITEYDSEKHIGCYVYSEIPFAWISKILFEDEAQLADSDKSIFPDFLWNPNLIDIINKEEFIEPLTVNYDDNNLLEIAKESGFIGNDGNIANKYKTAILQLINGTRNWTVGKHMMSFDSLLQDYFEISSDVIKEILQQSKMPVNDDMFLSTSETLSLVPTELKVNELSSEQDLYNILVDNMISNKESCTPTVIHELLERIKTTVATMSDADSSAKFSKTLDAIEGCYLNTLGFTVDEVLKDISTCYSENSILKALFFVIKNPAEFDKFILSLSIYKVDSLTIRRAMVLWAFLNGSKGVPAKGYNRDNRVLWENVEWKYSQIFGNTYKLKKPANVADKLCGIAINSEEIITFEEVYEFLVADKKHLTRDFLKRVYMVAKNSDRKLSKADPYSSYILTEENFYSKLPKLLSDEGKLVSKAEFDAFEKEYLKKYKELVKNIKKNVELNYAGIYKEWIINKDNFKKIWNVLEDDIKSFYVRQRG